MTKALTPEEKEAKKQAAAEKAARDAEAKAAAEEAARKQAEEAAREAEEQAARKQAEEQAAGAGAETPPSPATSYANTADDKAQRDAQAEKAEKGKKDKEQPTDAKAAELKAKGWKILADYPAEPTVYMTANGFGFFKHSDARNHADTLSDKEVLTVNKE